VDRRLFLQRSAALMAASTLVPARRFLSLTGARSREKSTARRILVLGGTTFLGPAIVEAAVAAGHTVTLFNRGITHPELFPHQEKLRGLRSAVTTQENLTALDGRRWDAVIDVWPFEPELAASAARKLAGTTEHYLYVSSIATYDPRSFAAPGLAEDAPLNAWDPAIRPYNRGKSESERRLQSIVGDRLTVVRPGAIKGARDDTPDVYAWTERARHGGRHIAPGTGDDHVQIVDVKDVARFMVLAIEQKLTGTFNLTGPAQNFREFVTSTADAVRSSAEFIWVPQSFLHAHGLDPAPWDSPTVPSYLGLFPYWHPEPERAGFYQISSERALAAGWKRRPYEATVLDYLRSMTEAARGAHWVDELSPEVEARTLSDWLTHRPG